MKAVSYTHLVILDLGPATRGHALILPREHADNLYELPEDTAAKVDVYKRQVLVGLVIIFKEKITEVVNSIFTKITNQTKKI